MRPLKSLPDYEFRTSLAKEVEGQMSIVTQLSDVSAQSKAFISGRSRVHGMVTYIHKQGGWGWRGRWEKSMGADTCGYVGGCLQNMQSLG